MAPPSGRSGIRYGKRTATINRPHADPPANGPCRRGPRPETVELSRLVPVQPWISFTKRPADASRHRLQPHPTGEDLRLTANRSRPVRPYGNLTAGRLNLNNSGALSMRGGMR